MPQDISRLMLMKGRILPLVTPQQAQNSALLEMDRMLIQESRKIHLVGSTKDVVDQLQREQMEYGFEEAMICGIPHSQEKRLDVYRLLAQQVLKLTDLRFSLFQPDLFYWSYGCFQQYPDCPCAPNSYEY